MSNIPPPQPTGGGLTLSLAQKLFATFAYVTSAVASVFASNVTIGGNLTVNGTGTSTFAGHLSATGITSTGTSPTPINCLNTTANDTSEILFLNGTSNAGYVGYNSAHGVNIRNGNGDVILNQTTNMYTDKTLKTMNNILDTGNGASQWNGYMTVNNTSSPAIVCNNSTTGATQSSEIQFGNVTSGSVGWVGYNFVNGMGMRNGNGSTITKQLTTGQSDQSLVTANGNVLDSGTSAAAQFQGTLSAATSLTVPALISSGSAFTITTGSSSAGAGKITLYTGGGQTVASTIISGNEMAGYCYFTLTGGSYSPGGTMAFMQLNGSYSSVPKLLTTSFVSTIGIAPIAVGADWGLSTFTLNSAGGITFALCVAGGMSSGNTYGWSWLIVQ